jgi:hypothetical protein
LFSGAGDAAAALSITSRGTKRMKHLHWELNAGSDDVISVDLSRAANVLLLDDRNYGAYRRGSSYRYHGWSVSPNHFNRFSATCRASKAGRLRWNVQKRIGNMVFIQLHLV